MRALRGIIKWTVAALFMIFATATAALLQSLRP
jgi:hypothetical protein